MIDVRSLGGSERLHTEVCLRECKHQLEELKRNELLGNRRKSQGAQACARAARIDVAGHATH